MAVMMPLLLIVLAGVLDFGRVIYINVVLTNGVREIALTGATRSIEESLLESLAIQELERAGIESDALVVSIEYTETGMPATDTIVVDANYQASLILTFLPFSNVTLHSHAELPIFWTLTE